MKFCTIKAILFVSLANVCLPPLVSADKLQQKVDSTHFKEYIVTTKRSVNEEELKRLFEAHSVADVKSLQSTKQFLIRFKKDPGLKKLQKLSDETKISFIIQPNFPVHTFGKKKLGIR
jgi:hypothetical protein